MMFANRNSVRNNKSMASLSFLLFIVSSVMSVACDASSMDILQRTLPAYALALKAETTLNSSTCGQELGVFRDAVDTRKWWALKMLDASGQPKPGFIYGNNFWFGSSFQCSTITKKEPFRVSQEFLRNMSIIRKDEAEFPPYKLHYFMTYFRHNTTAQYNFRSSNSDVISLGLCVPATCTIDQLSSILKIMFRERTLMFGELYKADLQLLYMKDMQDDRAWLMNPRIIIVLLVIAITIILMIAGTVYDILVYQKYLRAVEACDSGCNNERNTLDDRKINTEIPEGIVAAKPKEPSLFWQIMKCFSVYANTKYIFMMKGGLGSISCLDGLRVLSMAWVVLIHTGLYMYDYIDYTAPVWKFAAELSSQTVSNGTLVVDTYFFISAFLMAYYTFKYFSVNDTESKPIPINAKFFVFIDAIWKRFVRLTPTYMMIIGLSEMIYTSYGNTSVFSMKWERVEESCSKYWWRNLLYINNFFPRNEMVLFCFYFENKLNIPANTECSSYVNFGL